MKSKTIKVDYLARVEGEGGLLVKGQREESCGCEIQYL